MSPIYGRKNERKSVVSLSIVLLLLNLPYLVELGAEGVYLGYELLALCVLLLLHPLELLLEVAVGIAHTLPQGVLGLFGYVHLTL